MKDEIYITDLIDVDSLQKMQDAFCNFTGIAGGISDNEGIPVTKDTIGISTDFCMNYNKKLPVSQKRCQYCDKRGGEMALEKGQAVMYHCHTGLVDFAAPIMAGDKMIGSVLGGQVIVDEPDIERIKEIAREIGADEDEYLKALKKVKRVDVETLDKATKFLYTMANMLSKFAYNGYLALKARDDMEKVSNMKSDFLANMSHEIRTPMNSVIGMAEMALREDLTPDARRYITQIKSSGKTLLTIINDILDFSKIESGKMDINEAEYIPMSIINDCINTLMPRIGNKKIEFIPIIANDIPYKLKGDSTRIQQIIINIVNNAIKFTGEGKITLTVDWEKTGENTVNMKCSVKDTGIGIKKENMNRLFNSFEQLDSKRNRNIEGTGLGLAITKNLLKMMGGDIKVESEYGIGSEFSFYIPHEVIDFKPSISLKEPKPKKVIAAIRNVYVEENLKRDITNLGISYESLNPDLLNGEEKDIKILGGADYVFTDCEEFFELAEKFAKRHRDMHFVVITPFAQNMNYDKNTKNVFQIRKPVYSLNLASIFNEEDFYKLYTDDEDTDFKFIAPDARILIVDDNEINLTVAKGLLEPVKMQIDTATGGREAIDKISENMYDLIFMDHMMPGIDGVETTHIIRRMHKEYDHIPIIALTANAVDGTKEMFLKEGMNDFVPKPIELKQIAAVLRKWIPTEKIKKAEAGKEKENPVQSEHPKEESYDDIVIEGLDTKAAMKLLQNKELYMRVLSDYYKTIKKKAEKIKKYENEDDIKAYTIEVHALKSSSRQIGANKLADMAAELEKAGHHNDKKTIHDYTDNMLELFKKYEGILAPLFPEKKEENTRKEIPDGRMEELFEKMKEAIDNLDMDEMEEITGEIKEYKLDERQGHLFERLLEAVNDWDVDTCEAIVEEWETLK